ncbi:D-serine deaminase, pyridoxal phosphate-dependent [Agrococcus baldri]|uniref:D-serine deaminase, pyridoxal phosphate-dependent n=1 Tax=Agrococcus baldri TaxID=153730 RepID=A0AA94HQ26_9MICO|nr:alanine racemase [Agrococcus baldri]SFS19097.1 D-serine deaminase, pyridoxal phosphate-dependent [Agrococcus baldri]
MALSTPFLAIDLERMQANIARVAEAATARGIALRPHAKTHKTIEIGRMQVAAGAHGLTVATVGEAEVFAAAGLDDLCIAYPLWIDADKAARLSALAARGAAISVGVDSLEGVVRLVHAGLAGRVSARVEVDAGHHRSGCAPAAAGEVASAAVQAGVDVEGVFSFPGHAYAPEARERAARDEADALTRAAASLRDAGVEPMVISGGSTPSLAAALEIDSPVNELRPGVTVFGDAQQWELGSAQPEEIALTCHATVVSHAGGRLVLDAGSKVLGPDRATWASGHGRLLDHPEARVVQLSEHHAVVELPSGSRALPALGSVVRVVPNHVCIAVNMVDELVVYDRGDDREPAARWRVAARGRNA